MHLMNSLSLSYKTALAVVVLPLLLMAVGLWQLSRAPTPAQFAQEIAKQEAIIAQMRTLKPHQAIKLSDGKSYAPSLIASYAQKEIDNIKSKGAAQAVYLPPIAWGAIGTALATTLLGVMFMLRIRSMGARALRSRDDMLHAFYSGQKALPWFLALLAVLLFTAISCLLGYEVTRLILTDNLSKGDMKLVIAGVLGIPFLLYLAGKTVWNLIKASRAAFEYTPVVLMGNNVDHQEAPHLWSFVRDLADKVKAKMPDSIVVGLNECFFVTEHPVKLASEEPVAPGRVLYLPLPYMAFMSKSEVAAVIGHELGHFTGADTEYSLRFAPIYSRAMNNLVAVHSTTSDNGWEYLTKPVLMLGEYFLRSFDQAVQHWSRQRELAADQTGAMVASKEAAALALLRVSVLAPRVNEALANCWRKGEQTRGVLAETRHLIDEKGLDDPTVHLEEAQAHPTDSHPTTRQRVEALGVTISPAMLTHTQDPRGSGLLQELGLEGATPPTAAANLDLSDPSAPRFQVSESLEAEFLNRAQTDRQETLAVLEELAKLGTTPVSVPEGGIVAVGVMLVVGIATLVGPLAAWSVMPKIGYLFTLPIGAAFIWGGVSVQRRRAKPVMTLTSNGLIAANMAQEVPWSAITGFNVHVVENYGFDLTTLTLGLAEGYEPPQFSGDRRVKYKKQKQQLVITVFGPKGITPAALAELVDSHWRGAMAREELEKYHAAASH